MTRHGQGVTLSHSDARRSARPGLRPIAAAVTLSALVVTVSGCSVDWTDVVGFGWPKGITPEAHANYQLWIGTVLASVAVYLMVAGMIFWATIFHRKKTADTELPRQFGYNMPLELVLTSVPFIVIGILFYFTVVVQEKMVHSEAKPEVVVDVTAFQWNWKFGYQKVDYYDGTFGYNGVDEARKEAMVSRLEGVDEHGQPLRGAIAGRTPADRSYLNFDKVETLGTTNEIPVLVVPAGKRIEFVLNSADVVHSFWVPEFLFKRDVIPEPRANNQVNTFQVAEITKTGAFVGHCAEMCGTYHAMMNFELRVVSPGDFKSYLTERIAGKSNSEALKAINEEPLAVTTFPFNPRRGEQVKNVSNG